MNDDRFKEIEDRLANSSVKIKLDQIRKFLDLYKASVMVGAGFSKNAERGEDVHVKDWGELCEDFYVAMNGSRPQDGDFRLKSAPRIAQQLESSFGRAALDEIIKNSIPNDSISPGYLHTLLVKLNWRDIFTTNYDTLLEEAAENAFRHYNVVTSKDSLIYQSHPRIVKLHGSFPDNRPFIITEEDYRTYPAKFPEFVNTIRQALIETQFCLIGFSGDDPNFLSWLGWFRDILGEQMLPIYMIYMGPRPQYSEIKLLSQRNIEPIFAEDISKNPAEALEFILRYLGVRKNDDWSGMFNLQQYKKEQLKESIGTMRKIRETYPGWIILPENRIEGEFDDCRVEFPFVGKAFSELDNEYKLDFLYEYTWRLQTSLLPSWFENQWYVDALIEVMSRYDSIEGENRNKADYLSVALLQIHRILGDDGFNEMLKSLRGRIPQNNSALHRRLNYEEALWAISHCERKRVEEILKRWDITPEDYRGALWKSKILVETDRGEEAVKILEVSLDDARRKLLSNDKSGYLQSAVALISECLNCNRYSRSRNKVDDDRFQIRKYLDLCQKELNREDKHGEVRSFGFNIGSRSSYWTSGPSGYVMKYVGAGRYYLIAETYGFPVGARSDINQLALPLLAEVDLRAAVSYLVETNDEKALDVTLSREEMLGISNEGAVMLFDLWIKVLEPYINSDDKPLWNGREIEVVLPMLVRLCVWLDYERIIKIVRFMWNIYDYCHNDLSEYFKTCYNSLPIDKAVEMWWEVMAHPITLDFKKQDLVKPAVSIEEWKDDASIIDIIVKGLSNDSLDVRRAAVDRFGCIHNIIPPEDQSFLDKSILDNFDGLLSTNLVLFLGPDLKRKGDRIWKDRFYAYLNEQIDKFLESDFKISGSSAIIDEFEKYMYIFINCCGHFTPRQTDCVSRKILFFINENYDVLYNTNDSNSLLGGIKYFLDSAMTLLDEFIVRVGRSLIRSDVRRELIEKLKLLVEKYPLIRSIVHISFLNETGAAENDVEETYQFIKSRIEKDCFSSDKNRMINAFRAAVECQRLSEGVFPFQEIVRRVIYRTDYILDSVSEYILEALQIWLRHDIIKGENLEMLFDVLSALPQRINDTQGIPAELKSNILYRGAFLAGVISKSDFADADGRKCVDAWQSFAESNSFPHDIRNGYYEGSR